jgi:predicted acetyltransferase
MDTVGTVGTELVLLRPLSVADEAVARAAHDELAQDGFSFLLDEVDDEDWPRYVARLGGLARGPGVPDGRVAATFLVAEVGGQVVGRTSIRHALNDYLAAVGGHIGYGVRPAFRRRGYATEILRQSLARAAWLGVERALVTCDIDNAGSASVIERCGGILENVVPDPFGGPDKRRYWIDLTARAG